MLSPNELRKKLIKQWLSAKHREQRFADKFNWPIKLSIGKPSAFDFKNTPANVRDHLKLWRNENKNKIEWQTTKYQSASSTVEIPVYYCINSTKEWIDFCDDKNTHNEFKKLESILNHINKKFHSLFIRQRSLWQQPSTQNIIKCCELAMQLKPGIAEGKPLRALSIANIDSKFIENNRSLICRLLNIIFDDALKNISLEKFLDATETNEHWLLVIPLAETLLPFKQLRLRSSELETLKLPGSHLLIVENERCAYQLPALENTLAILGAGLNLSWLRNPDFKNKQLAYWGDIDSWGLQMLSMARAYQVNLTPVLMNKRIYKKHQQQAIKEPQIADEKTPCFLTVEEAELYKKLLTSDKGRLEQEFIDVTDVHAALFEWRNLS